MNTKAPRVFIVKSLNRATGLVESFKAIVDAEDAYHLRSTVWNVLKDKNRNYYLARQKYGVYIHLHKLLLDAGEDVFVTHINGNTLDNRKSNLKAMPMIEKGAHIKRNPNVGALAA